MMESDRSYNVLLQSLLGNILNYTDSPNKFAGYLCQEIISIIGVKIVCITSDDSLTGQNQILSLLPLRKKEQVSQALLNKLSEMYPEIKSTIYIESGTPESEIIINNGFNDCLIIPLISNNTLEGKIFLFDLYEQNANTRVIETLNKLSGLCAVIIRNSKLFQNLESQVELRTKELELKNKQLEENENILKTQNEVYAKLNEELIDTNKQLLIAKDKALESDRLKTAFLQNMSHEIRTPMNAIMGFSELLIKQFNNKEKLSQYARIIQQRSSDLLELINEILDIAKIESGQLPVNLENCNLTEMFSEIETFFNVYRNKIQKQNVSFSIINDCKANDFFLTDKVKLKQIFINLITNAFKFTEKGSIQAGCRQRSDSLIEFFVSDTGVGIPADKLNFIFERFSQLDHGSKVYSGTGLGLPIVKGLVNLLGGEINVHSDGTGSRFVFMLPGNISPSMLVMSETNGSVNEKLFEGSILIVEDDSFNAEYLKEILTEFKVKTFYAENGEKALEIVDNNNIDLVLLDFQLPGMQGDSVSQIIKTKKPNIRILAQTAYASENDRQHALNSGCDDFISKPVKSQMLIDKVFQLLSTKR